MKKIKLKIKPDDGQRGSHLFPLLDYFASKGIFPEKGNYPDDKNIFEVNRDSSICRMNGEIDYQDMLDKIEFSEFITVDAESGLIYDHGNSIEIFVKQIGK